MAFTIPNEVDASNVAQAMPDKVDFDILLLGMYGTGVVRGAGSECAVTAQGTPDMTLAVASGNVIVAATPVLVAAGNVTITTANATNPRFDLVVVNNSGTKSVTAGTAAAAPVFPAVPANSVCLAAVYVPANDTAIGSTQITDKRCIIDFRGVIQRSGAAVTVVNTTTETTLMNWTIPGLLQSTFRSVRLTLIGDYINNSGAGATLTLKVYYGATFAWNDVSASITASASRRPFILQLMVSNVNNTGVQFIGGTAWIGVAGGASNGIGDLGAAGFIEAAFATAGAMAIDTTINEALQVTATHSVAASTIDIRMHHALLELL